MEAAIACGQGLSRSDGAPLGALAPRTVDGVEVGANGGVAVRPCLEDVARCAGAVSLVEALDELLVDPEARVLQDGGAEASGHQDEAVFTVQVDELVAGVHLARARGATADLAKRVPSRSRR